MTVKTIIQLSKIMKIRIATAFISSFLFFIFLELADFYFLKMFWFAGLALLSVIYGSIFTLPANLMKSLRCFDWLAFLFAASSFIFLIFLDRDLFRQFIIILASFLLFWNFYYRILTQSALTESFVKNNSTVESMTGAISAEASMATASMAAVAAGSALRESIVIVSQFLLGSIFFGWLIFLQKIDWLFVLLAAFTSLLFSRKILIGKIEAVRVWRVSVVLAVIFAEIFWVLGLLPIGFLVKGFLYLVIWWTVIKTIVFVSQGKNWKTRFFYLPFAFLIVLIVLLTARWL